jgi:hypothetical protein
MPPRSKIKIILSINFNKFFKKPSTNNKNHGIIKNNQKKNKEDIMNQNSLDSNFDDESLIFNDELISEKVSVNDFEEEKNHKRLSTFQNFVFQKKKNNSKKKIKFFKKFRFKKNKSYL